jgi:hypothetical protein
MFPFLRADLRRFRLGLPTERKGRLSLGRAVLAIAGLSALAWAVLILIVLALRAML